ncbi:glutathione peroxidase [Telluria aromaticivorans]|uniref:Glutathione peroxidase n=1 Tax=Telluria aromaticivorans TaxID=2725995 RepID=A0A7Y2K029_9BURK|nr:glutathione peroxidase [Telluria aromaticivorans]NNG23598.1 glutathione peroxidase [Telluria aromaticivorans]
MQASTSTTLPTPESLQGKPVPNVTFKARPDDEWQDLGTDALFKGKTVVVFSLPGAFTPTCSSTHLPRYNELAPVLRENGVDDILCISVNDAFVMNQWKAGQDASNITVIPDGNGDFTEGMGMLVDKRDLGFGQRSWRYAMLVKDGVIDKIFIEPEREGDPFEVSDADTMLRYINPEAKIPEAVVVFSRPGCPHCARAKTALSENGIVFTDVSEDQKITSNVLRAVTGSLTWPQAFVGGRLIGGADDVQDYLDKQGR